MAPSGKRDRDLIVASLVLWLLTLPLQTKIAGSLQISNLGDVASMLLLAPVLKNLFFSRTSVVIIAVCLLFLGISAFFAARMPFGMFLSVFYVFSTLHILVYCEAVRRDAELLHRIIRIIAITSRWMTVAIILHFAITRQVPYAFLMQDKTYFLVYLNTLIVSELLYAHLATGRFTTIAILNVTALVFLQLPTASRSIIIFAPFIVLACLGNFFRRDAAIAGRVLFFVALAGVITYISLHFEQVQQIATVVRRLSTVLEAGDTSVGQHGILVQVALHEKFQDWPTFLFGTGSAGFQVVAERSELFPELMMILPDFGFAAFSSGFTYFPGTSIWAESLLEWPIFIWIPFVAFMAWMALRILAAQRFVYAVFVLAVYAGGVIYSFHHSSFFFLTLLLIAILAFGCVDTRRGRMAADAGLPVTN